MSTVKTAFSISKTLLTATDEAARELNLPRSQVIALALEEFLCKHRNQQLLTQLNAAYGDDAFEEEHEVQTRLKPQFRAILENDEQ
ncbi:MAG TPA: CopG family transcriptional regulator [Acidobacteriota bacterium]|nr:CopG family transcriptional regulator [Acidobacteriota bacterium]HNC43499.1 CopG family transcriptional regulator [Acidobacteriota bacterium]HNG96259.1 CopG family transcriptional regulator [Acidobacteriota bacterium]HNH84919.1 CopG family transcriptional regulator [Acidobacteriota bacterium]HNJ42951.1 CopG family transcriptional regulator [Acidobacteriota bacterium]